MILRTLRFFICAFACLLFAAHAFAQCSVSITGGTMCAGNIAIPLDAVVTGSGTVTYSWTSAANTSLYNISGANASGWMAAPGSGSVTVTATFSNGCVATDTATITSLTVPTIDVNPSIATVCTGDSVTICASGAVSYQWFPAYGLGNTTGTCVIANPVQTTTYMVIGTAANGCPNVKQFVITHGETPQMVLSPVPESCGPNSAAVTAFSIGGSNSYNYVWSNGMTEQSIDSINAGTYSVTVTDPFSLCTATTSITVTQTPPPLVTVNGTTTSTCGQADGGVDISVSGGYPPYTYLWENNSTDEDLVNVGSGTYTISVTDANYCTMVDSVVIPSTPFPALAVTITNATCGLSNGSVTSSLSSATSPYNYLWNGGATTSNLINLSGGTYSVTMTDANGCTATASATLTNSTPPILSTAVTHTLCNQPNGAIDLTVVGITPFTYSWSPAAITQDISGLASGLYSVTVTDSLGCTSNTSATVNASTAPQLTLVPTPATCGNANGSIDLSVSQGTTPYTYLWNGTTTTQDLNSLLPGMYVVVVTDANQCTATDSAVVVDAASPTIAISGTNATCGQSNGLVDITVTGGTLPFTFNWNSGQYNTEDLSNVIDNTYTVLVTDSNGCTSTNSIVLTNSPLPAISFTATASMCGDSSASVNVTMSVGQPPYTFNWNNNAFITEDLANVPSGAYILIATDSFGCSATDTVNVQDISGPQITVDSIMEAGCGNSNGAIDISLSGTSPFNIIWSNGATTEDIANVMTGTYTSSVTDGNGCTAELPISVSDASAPSLNATTVSATCSQQNGSIDLTVNGGAAPYTFVWSNNGETTEDLSNIAAGTHSVTVTDALGCNAVMDVIVSGTTAPTLAFTITNATCGSDNGAIDLQVTNGTAGFTFAWNNAQPPTEDLSNLAAGTYSVTVTDANNCSASSDTDIVAIAVPTLSSNIVHTTCGLANGSIDITVNGSSSPYTYAWSNSAGTDEDLTNLAANTYDLTVTDANNCDVTGSYTVNTSLALVLSVITTNASCGASNGAADLTVTNGTIPISYDWGANGTNEDLTNVQAGNYSVTVTDGNQCSASLDVVVSNPNAPTISLAAIDATCEQLNGSIDATVNGGAQPYIYDWSNGSTQQDLSNIDSGVYTLTVTDASGCSTQESATILTTSSPVIGVVVTNEVCNAANGLVDVTVTNVSSATFYWSPNGEITEDIANLSGGNYAVTITSNTGCTADTSVTVTNIPCAPTVTLDPTDATCGLNNGSIDLTISGGAGPFEFIWDNGQTTEDATNLSSGTHYVTVTDAAGTTTSYNAVVTGVAAPTLTIVGQDEACDQNNGSVALTVNNGSDPFTYTWSNGATTEDLISLQANTYTVTVSDANNCTVSASVTLNNVAGPSLSYTTTNATCSQAVGAVDITVTGGTGGFTYDWTGSSANTQDLVNIFGGTYTVTVTDGNNCTASISADVVTSNAPQVSISTLSSTCGNANGAASATASNGTQPYTYEWSNGETSATLINVLPVNYCVTVTDAIGCTVVECEMVNNIAGPTVNIATTPEACYQQNGAANATVTNGTSPFTFYWNTAATTEDISGLATGAYAVTVTDDNGCTTAQNVLVGFSAAPDIQTLVTPVTCNADNGLVDITVSGVSPYTFAWSSNATTEDASQLAPGNYSVTVTDINNCTSTASAYVDSIIPGTVSISGVAANICEGQSFTVSASGMNTYQWTPAAGLNATTGSNVIITPIVAQTYTVTGTDSNSCTHSISFVVDPLPLPVVNVAGPYTSCSPYSIQLLADTSNVSSIAWHFTNGFSSGDVSPTFTFPTGVFGATIYATSPNGCADTILLPAFITVLPSPIAEFKMLPITTDPDMPATEFKFINLSSQADAFIWSFGDSSLASYQFQPTHQYDDYLTYPVMLIAINANGCTDTAFHLLTVEEPRLFFVPNTFTPNGDGNNDYFQLYGRNVSTYELRVYDRTGELVYFGNQDSQPWNGTLHGMPLNTGVYVYSARVVYDTGVVEQGHGDVTLLR